MQELDQEGEYFPLCHGKQQVYTDLERNKIQHSPQLYYNGKRYILQETQHPYFVVHQSQPYDATLGFPYSLGHGMAWEYKSIRLGSKMYSYKPIDYE